MQANSRWRISEHMFTPAPARVLLGLAAAAAFACRPAGAQVLPTNVYQDPTSGAVVQQGVNLLTGTVVQQAYNPYTGTYVSSNGLSTTYANGLGSGNVSYNPFTGTVTGQNTSINTATGAQTSAYTNYNPYTGQMSTTNSTVNPYTGTRANNSVVYNPYTGLAQVQSQNYNPYTGWSTSNVVYNPANGSYTYPLSTQTNGRIGGGTYVQPGMTYGQRTHGTPAIGTNSMPRTSVRPGIVPQPSTGRHP